MRLPSCCSPYNDDETSLMAAVFGFLFYSCIDFLSQMDGEFKSLMMIRPEIQGAGEFWQREEILLVFLL